MITVRKAEPTDADLLFDVLQELGFPFIAGTPREQALARVTHHLSVALGDDSHSIYIAHQDDGVIVGYVAVHWLPYLILAGPEGFVSELFLREGARGQGIGTRLLAVVKEEARQRGCARLSLLNMQDRESYQRGFYHQDGWEERPDARNFIFRLTPK